MIKWSPAWAPHVVGEYTERVPGEEQRYKITCAKCGAVWGPTLCNSGMVRRHIGNFASSHAHTNPLLQKK